MRSFDPDVDDPYVEVDDGAGRHLDDDLVAIDEEAALALLDRVTATLDAGESRAGQREMVAAVARAVSRRRNLVIEAGTGVGKSLGYLVPLSLAKRRVVVATATKNLQDQLASKDAPLVAAQQSGLRVAVLKGRQNYLCRLRVAETGGDAQLALEDGEELPRGVAAQLRRALDWSHTTTSGDRDELGFEIDSRAWRQLSVTPQECLGRAVCPRAGDCFVERARDNASASDVVIVNAHLYAAHLASGSMILPEHDLVVFDEAHEIPDIFAQALGTEMNATRLRAVAAVARPLLGADGASDVAEVADVADRLERALGDQVASGELTGLSESVVALLEAAGRTIASLVDRLRATKPDDPALQHRHAQALGPAVHVSNDLARLRSVQDDELVWLSDRDGTVSVELSLVEVGARLDELLWPAVTAVLTSATIPSTLRRDLGLESMSDELRVASPFDYRNHSLLYVPSHLPHRNDDAAEEAIASELTDLITAAGGRTLALFTNRAVMRRVAEVVEARISTPVLVQDTLSRTALIERFREEPDASLFAVTSYWQGVDVPGDSLALVTIDRLPFARPDDPLSQARRDRAGERAFMEVDLPRAAMMLAQGVGRLIRTTSDRGVVAVLDTRLATARYRGLLLDRLPPMRRTRDKAEVEAFLREIDRGERSAQ